MNRDQIREMIMVILGKVDYDLMKSFLPELSEDPEETDETMEELISLVEKHLKRAKY